MRRDYFLKDPSRIELMLDIHDRILRAIVERDAERATRELEIHYDIQIEQIYGLNEGSHPAENGKPEEILADKGGDHRQGG
jgi:DNA-binding GntR family transcriptional regulator